MVRYPLHYKLVRASHGAHQSSGNNFFHFSLFSSFHLKRCVDLVKLQNGPQSFNCIEFDLVVFQFHSLTFDFLYFFYQI